MHTLPLEFPGADGHRLSARLDLPPDGETRGCAIFAHCFTCSKNLNAVVNISRALTREGLSVLRFDFTGLGESEGEFAETNFSSNVADLVAAAAFMAGRGTPAHLLVGHSLGGAAVLVAAPQIASLRAVATLCAPADVRHVARLLGESAREVEAAGEAVVELGGRPFRVRRQLLEDLGEARVDGALRALTLPLLVMHSPADQVVELDHATRIFRAARGSRSFVSLDGADHLLSDRRDAQYAGRVIAAWASRYLPVPPDPTVKELAEEGRVVTVTRGGAFRTEIATGRHCLVADEPVAVGGADAGPSPYDLLLAALGACTGMTLRMYADRKQWPLEETTVRLRHGKVHALDEEHPGEPGALVDRVERELELDGPLDAEQRARLLEIAERCPVHRTLTASVRVETTLVAGETTPAP
ncbi:MAG TPA: alpha/beta fold hydrolase [Longimicrobiaceae bacterium]|nr:alpha/beta fold hydrolase [Longimicrobiaceae bacterium]